MDERFASSQTFGPVFFSFTFKKSILIIHQSEGNPPAYDTSKVKMKNSDKAHSRENNFKGLIALIFSYFTTHYQAELKDRFCLLLYKLESILTGDHSW